MAALCMGQETATFEGYPAVTLSTGKLRLTIMRQGGALANLWLADDPEKLSPFWNPMRAARELGQPPRFDGGAGQFVCVDGFGPPSTEERAAGLVMHGEAHSQLFEVRTGQEGAAKTVTMRAELPIVQEVFTRTFRAVAGENVVYVDSELESKLGFDRPVNWAEHATLGSPFLESGVTLVDLSGSRSKTRSYGRVEDPQGPRRLTSGQDFSWPMAPGLDGKPVNLRETPGQVPVLDHATTLLDPRRKLEWVTALNPKKGLIFGYLFRQAEYPWLQYWGYYPAGGKFARGMEFGTQPFDVPRRQVISEGPLFETPTFRWLPAKSKISTRFLLFYAHVPTDFRRVDEVRLENHGIVIEDRSTGKQIKLSASGDL